MPENGYMFQNLITKAGLDRELSKTQLEYLRTTYDGVRDSLLKPVEAVKGLDSILKERVVPRDLGGLLEGLNGKVAGEIERALGPLKAEARKVVYRYLVTGRLTQEDARVLGFDSVDRAREYLEELKGRVKAPEALQEAFGLTENGEKVDDERLGKIMGSDDPLGELESLQKEALKEADEAAKEAAEETVKKAKAAAREAEGGKLKALKGILKQAPCAALGMALGSVSAWKASGPVHYTSVPLSYDGKTLRIDGVEIGG